MGTNKKEGNGGVDEERVRNVQNEGRTGSGETRLRTGPDPTQPPPLSRVKHGVLFSLDLARTVG